MANAIILHSDTLEGQFAEIIHTFMERESNPITNPQGLRLFSGDWQIINNQFIFQGNFQMRTIGDINESGELVLKPVEYLIEEPQGEE